MHTYLDHVARASTTHLLHIHMFTLDRFSVGTYPWNVSDDFYVCENFVHIIPILNKLLFYEYYSLVHVTGR